MIRFCDRLLARIQAAVLRHGVFLSTRMGLRYVWKRLIVRSLAERFFDWRWQVDTGGLIPPRSDFADGQTNAYQGTLPGVFRRLLAQVPVDFSRFTFVDLGCGKGRTLFMASKFPFKAIIGVELDPALVDIASNNVRRCSGRAQSRKIEVVCANAVDYRFPSGDLLVYLSNPFHEVVMQSVIENLSAMVRKGTEIYLVYHEPRLAHLFEGCGYWSLLAKTSQGAIYHSSGLASRTVPA